MRWFAFFLATASALSLSPQVSTRGGGHVRNAVPSALAESKSGDTVIIGSSFRLSLQFLAAGLVLDTIPYIQLTLGPFITLLGALFFVQTLRLRFVCEPDNFALQESTIWTGDEKERDTGENIVVGGKNRWAYKKFVNYDSFPKGWLDQPQGPILVYFKETQTPSDKWNEGPGKDANSPDAIANGAKPGQVHFFPALCDTKALFAEFEKRGCNKL